MEILDHQLEERIADIVSEALEGIVFEEAIRLNKDFKDTVQWDSISHRALRISLDTLGEVVLSIPENLSKFLCNTLLPDLTGENPEKALDLENEILNCIGGALLAEMPERGQSYQLGFPEVKPGRFSPDEYDRVYYFSLDSFIFAVSLRLNRVIR